MKYSDLFETKIDPSEISGNPEAYHPDDVLAAWKKAKNPQDKELLAKGLDRIHGVRGWNDLRGKKK